jgi:hypothetical protein
MANEFSTYDQVGKAEDVSSIITNITPTDTPFTSLIKSEKVNARVFEWMEDALPNAADNKAVEGADFVNVARAATTLRTNNTQILSDVFEVTATADSIRLHGRAKETAHQLSKALKSIKRDLEFAYVGQNNAKVTGNATTAREMDSVIPQISTTVDAGSNATDAMTEAKLLELGEDCYGNGSDPTTFMIKPADAQIVAGFTAASGRSREINDGNKTLVNAIDLYVSPYGEYRVILNRHLLSTHALLIDPTMFRSCVLRPFTRTLLAKLQDGDRHAIVGEYSLKHMSYSDSGMITGLS